MSKPRTKGAASRWHYTTDRDRLSNHPTLSEAFFARGKNDNQIINREKTAAQKRHWVRLTQSCNNSCLFCLDSDSHDGKFLSFKEVAEDLKQGIKDKAQRVILSGGDPTIHPDFIKIIKQSKKMGYGHIQVITNGRLFYYRNFLLKAVDAGLNEVTFSIHGHNAALHDGLTGVKGSFKQAVTALKHALNIKHLITNIDICVNKKNVKHLREILDYFINLGVYEFDLLQIVPFGRAWRNRAKLFYDVREAMPHISKALELKSDNRLHLWTNRFPAEYLEGNEDLIQDPSKLHSEMDGMEDEFRKFFNSGRMSCAGERCRFCFLEKFCAYLKKRRQEGSCSKQEINHIVLINKKTAPKILSGINKFESTKDKAVFSAKNHLLLSQSIKEDIDLREFFSKLIKLSDVKFQTIGIPFCFYPNGRHLNRKNGKLNFFSDSKHFNPHAPVDDFILNGYYVKSLRCADCKHFKKCPGAHINYIRNFGFKSLTPIKQYG